MDTARMIHRLAVRLEDPDKDKFTDVFKLKTLNNAQKKLPQFVHTAYLTELQYLKENFTVTTGVTAALTSANITYDLLRSGQGILKVKDYATGIYLTQIGLKDLKKNENRYSKATVLNPYFYIAANKIYVLPTSGITAITLFILRQPATMQYTFTASSGAQTQIISTDTNLSTTSDYYNGLIVYNQTDDAYFVVKDYAHSDGTYTITVNDPGAGVTAGATGEIFYFLKNEFDDINKAGVACELNPCLHEIVLRMAEAECWAMDRKLHRRNAALESAFNEIQVLNSRYGPAEGIGTSAYKRFMGAAAQG